MPETSLVPPDANRRAVSTLLEIAQLQRQHRWQPQELASVWRHQLRAPLSLSLGTLSAEAAHQMREARPSVDALLTFEQLLHDPHPPVELLRVVKRFAKNCRNNSADVLPAEIVMLLYYAAITIAWTRCGERISHLSGDTLRRGVRWVARQAWVDDRSRDLLLEAVTRLDSRE